jgi:alpha-beta hydrolase superfamily lysophospholipase
MKIVEAEWKTPDGVRLYTREWIPSGDQLALVVLVHGLGEHCARYDHVTERFASNGIHTLGFDHRGHGRSEGKRGHIPGYDLVLQDIDHFIFEAKRQAGDLPVFLYGHSMGGEMVLYYAIQRRPDIRGVISTSPGLATGVPVPPVKLAAAKTLYLLAPSLTMDNGLDVQNLSHDRAVVDAYRADPLVTEMVSARLGLDLINTGKWVLEHASEFPLPLLLMQGSADHIVSPEATRQFAEKVPHQLLTFRLWENLYHETHNEFEKDQVIQMMVDWMLKRSGEKP